MSDEFWRHYGNSSGGFLNQGETEDEQVYQPWRTGNKPPKLWLHGAPVGQSQRWRLPYLQTILQRYDEATGQLCLMYPSSRTIVFMEGWGLDELDDLIEDRRVRSVHMFDPEYHYPIGNDVPIISNIIVQTADQSSS